MIVMRRRFEREHILTDKAETRVDVIKMFIGADWRLINFAIDDGARGLVVEGLGRGNVTVAALPAIERAINAGLPVVITSRCPRGAGAGHVCLRRRGQTAPADGRDFGRDAAQPQSAH